MKIKRIITMLLTVALLLTFAVVVASANDNAMKLAVNVESADAEGNVFVDANGTVKVSVAVTQNPGASVLQFTVNYDADALTLKTENGKVLVESTGKYSLVNSANEAWVGVDASIPGKLTLTTDMWNDKVITETGDLFTFYFVVKANVTGHIDPVTISNAIALSGYNTVTVAPATEAKLHMGEAKVVAPSCTAGGYTERACSCGFAVKYDEKAQLTHVEEIIPAKEATTTEKGLTEGKKCSLCGEILLAQEEVPMLSAGTTPPDTTPADDNGSLLWLWIVIAVVVVAAAGVAVYFFVVKKKK